MALELVSGQLVALHLGRQKGAGRLSVEQVSVGKLNNTRESLGHGSHGHLGMPIRATVRRWTWTAWTVSTCMVTWRNYRWAGRSSSS